MSDRSPFYQGGFGSYQPPRVKSLSQAQPYLQSGDPFAVRPGGSSYSVFEGPSVHFAPSEGTVWTQLVATSEVPKQSTKYENLFPQFHVSELTRANKALVAGHSDSLSPEPNTWHHKPYSQPAAFTASLLRLNEATTAFGSERSRDPGLNAGIGLMAEVLHQKWSAKHAGDGVDTSALLSHLTAKYPQLDTVKKMRGQKESPLEHQIAESRHNAAVSAGQRAIDTGKAIARDGSISWHAVAEHVQHKFARHGLGDVPGGWAAELRERHGK